MILHERWFVQRTDFPVDLSLALSPTHTLLPLAIAAVASLGAYALWRATGRKPIIPGPRQLGISAPAYAELLSFMPLVIGVHAAVLLMVSGVSRQLFVPNLPLPANLMGALFGLAQIVVALSFFYGALTRVGAVLLALVWFAGAAWFGPVLLLEHVFLLGIAAFLFATGRGPLSLDMVMRGRQADFTPLLPNSVRILRVFTGLSIAVLAFTEKLWNQPLAEAFLAGRNFNFMPALGFDVSNETFILIAGIIELTMGALLISGAFIRPVILLAWLPFNLTLPLLGWRELVGHLPIYGIMALLLIWGEEKAEKEEVMVSGMERHVI